MILRAQYYFEVQRAIPNIFTLAIYVYMFITAHGMYWSS